MSLATAFLLGAIFGGMAGFVLTVEIITRWCGGRLVDYVIIEVDAVAGHEVGRRPIASLSEASRN